ncbi:calbindin-32-like isoform X1 [Saccoglossus kowalevskii]|uniref:Calbindin-32-like isoform X4 n=1 Tax=Saccoglossus kowalevskii TaxID=10224 RepID=A0ABM0MDD5_SACKO|nr:PREDICTED: calbindin-32-like isoform X4 [Saccoglossus kowalevskii]
MATQAERGTNFMAKFRNLKKLTAHDFMTVWDHYDMDGNGYIEDGELDAFFRELIQTSGGPETISDAMLTEMKKCFMEAYDMNEDGKISLTELSNILPTDENFLLLFRAQQPLRSSVEFMEAWRKYDTDRSGFIESLELKHFLLDLLTQQKTHVEDKELDDYTKAILEHFDSNKDGKLEIKEMARLLPVQENFLMRFEGSLKPGKAGKTILTKKDFDRVFDHYDKDKNGKIEGAELAGFLKDLMEHEEEDLDLQNLEDNVTALLEICDVNKDGTLQKDELRMVLCAGDIRDDE